MTDDEQYVSWLLLYGSNKGILEAFEPKNSELRNPEYKSLLENIFKDDPELAYFYADITEKRFELGEPAIVTNAKYAYYYAISVVNSPGTNNRWKEAEDIIASEPCWGFYYSIFVLEDRFPEYEKYIQESDGTNNYHIRYKELYPF